MHSILFEKVLLLLYCLPAELLIGFKDIIRRIQYYPKRDNISANTNVEQVVEESYGLSHIISHNSLTT